MGEWQVAGVGGTLPLWNILGEAIEGRFSFEARNYLSSFQSYVRFEEFSCFPRFWKIWRKQKEQLPYLIVLSLRAIAIFHSKEEALLFPLLAALTGYWCAPWPIGTTLSLDPDKIQVFGRQVTQAQALMAPRLHAVA